MLALDIVLAVGIWALPLRLIRHGSRATAVVVTALGAANVVLLFFGFNPLSLLMAEGGIASSVAIWRPAARAYLTVARREQPDRTLNTRARKAFTRLR